MRCLNSQTNKLRTLEQLSYGIRRPVELLDKLRHDAEKLTKTPHPHDIFNFILTAAVLTEWVQKYYCSDSAPEPFSAPNKIQKIWLLPSSSPLWITDTSCIPNRHRDFNHHIANTLSICTHTANASKHYHWNDGREITAIGKKPPINDYYQYFFTSRAQDIYVTINQENYALHQIKGILIQFLTGLIEYLEGLQLGKRIQ